MARIFISHNSKDAKEAAAIKHWLADNGWDDVFLDIDTKNGLSPGQRWKDELKIAADLCEAVLCLISPDWLASAECKLEFRYAETLRKHVLPALIKPCNTQDLPSDWQRCLLYGEGQQTTIKFNYLEQNQECSFLASGLERLKIGLEKAGIGAESFKWPPDKDENRAPYRGLKPLEAVDAAVFFGRGTQILHGMETIRDMRKMELERLLVIIGASGSGKSSFMRAGLLPRLARDNYNFLPLPVIRPRSAVLTGIDGLATALLNAYLQFGEKRSLNSINQSLAQGWVGLKVLLAELEQLLPKQQSVDTKPVLPTLVIPIDQAEELFNADSAKEAELFLNMLSHLLADNSSSAAETLKLSPLALMTIRSDRYERLQTSHWLAKVSSRLFDLKPLPHSQFERIINGPSECATRAGRKLIIDPELTTRLLSDFSTGADTLPLLGFTLEKLYYKYGGDGLLDLNDYEDIRGSYESVQAAIFQEAIDTALAEPFRSPVIPSDPGEQYQALHRAFIPKLAQINRENNEPMRKLAKLEDLPADVHPLIERLVEARLLIRDKDVIEVAHESLFRQWPSLRGWLSEDLDKLRQRDAISIAAAEWVRENRREDLLVHRDGRLKDAKALLATLDYAFKDDSTECSYLNACSIAQEAREIAAKAEQERRIQDAERIAQVQKRTTRNTRIGLAVAVVLVIVVSFIATLAIEEKHATQQALAETDFRDALKYIDQGQRDLSLVLLAHAIRTDSSYLPGRVLLINLLSQRVWMLPTIQLLRHEAGVTSAQFSPDGSRVVTASWDKTARVWDAHSGQPLTEPMRHEDGVTSAQFSPDGSRVVTASNDKTALVWDAHNGQPLTELMRHEADVTSALFSPDGSRVVTVSANKTARVWNAFSGQPLAEPMRHEDRIFSAQFSLDGNRVVTASWDKTARVWDAHNGQPLTEPMRHEAGVASAQFSPDGSRVVTASWDKTARVWDVPILTSNDADLLASLAEALAQRRISENGLIIPIRDAFEQISKLRTETSQATKNKNPGEWFVHWVLSDRWQRTISPFSDITVDDYIQRRIAEGRIDEANKYFPGHTLLVKAKQALLQQSETKK